MTTKQKAKRAEYHKAWYAANREAVKARVRAYAAEHKDKVVAYKKAHRLANAERLKKKSRAYYEAHREERIAYMKSLHASKPEAVKAYKKQWWESNREAFAAARKTPKGRAAKKRHAAQWYVKHPEYFAAQAAKRKARKLGSPSETISYKQILRDSKGLCGICKKPLDLFGIDFDHIVPLSKGGAHTRGNIQASHAHCNRSKGAKVG